MEVRKTVPIAFRSLILLLQPTECTGKPDTSAYIAKVCDWLSLKILTPKKSHSTCTCGGNTSETLLDEIRQIMYSLYRVKEITK